MLEHEPTGGTEPSATDPIQPEPGPDDPSARRNDKSTRSDAAAAEQPAASEDKSTEEPPAASEERTTPVGESPTEGGVETSGGSPPARPPEPPVSPIQPFGAPPPPQEPVTPSRQPTSTVLFMPPTPPPPALEPEPEPEAEAPRRRRRTRRSAEEPAAAPDSSEAEKSVEPAEPAAEESADASASTDQSEETTPGEGRRTRRRGRRGRGRGKGAQEPAATDQESEPGEEAPSAEETDTGAEPAPEPAPEQPARAEGAAGEPTDTASPEGETTAEGETTTGVTRRRRRRRRKSGAATTEPETTTEDGIPTVVKVREPRPIEDEVRGVTGSTRLEAKRQRRRGGRDQRRTRPPVLTESEFLARREAVDRVMVIRDNGPGRSTQIAVLEDGILVEHYVSRANAASMVGSVYLGKVQNVLPSMEAAFVDLGRGRNAVLYAGEVNWEASGLAGKSRSIEQALSPGDSVLVQVTKDPVGHKGARLTSNLALSGRHLVYTPNGSASGISRKLPENERRRLRGILKDLVPEGAGVIVRTAAENATTEDLSRDVKRLQAQWEDIQAKAATATAPALLYSEPDLVVRVVRDLFNEDFRELVIEGDEAYETVEAYLSHVSPDLVPRLRRHTGTTDVFSHYRIDEQILKGLDRKVYLPSGGHLVFDRTEAMTVIDVNTGKYTGTGGNLEETVTRNNLEAAEEIVRQLRLRDIGGIIVIDFIDMVLESNRELVLRRLIECLARDRTKHQVTEITSLGLVQMTRKRVGAGLLEAFSEPCECCKGRGVVVHTEPVGDKPRNASNGEKVRAVAAGGSRRRSRRSEARAGQDTETESTGKSADDDTMGYDLSRYEEAQAPAPEVVRRDQVEPVNPTGAASANAVTAVNLGEENNQRLVPPEEAGLTGMFRRLRRRGGKHRAP